MRPLAVLAALAVAFGPVVAWNGLLGVKDGGGQVGVLSSICDAVGDSKTILMIRDNAPINYSLSIKTVCRVQVVSVWSYAIKDGNLAELYGRTGEIPVVAFTRDAMPYPRRTDGGSDYTATVPTWSRQLTHVPDEVVTSDRTLFFGELQADGTVTR